VLFVLRIALILSALFALIALSYLVIKTLLLGRKRVYSRDKGSKLAGIVYAFGKGMMPWEKESAQKHLLVYLAGVGYHVGIFAGLFYLASLVLPFTLRQPIALTERVLLFLGSACGVALLSRRITSPAMRKLSCPDDYAANSIVTIVLILSGVHSQLAGPTSPTLGGTLPGYPNGSPAGIETALLLASSVMFLYVPLGKIRHCVFFFYVRVLFGIFYGRRDALAGTRGLAPTRATRH
jgi:hypothetical protein